MAIVGDSIEASNGNWTFSGPVADSFDDHVSKSVPFYNEGHSLVTELSDYFVTNGSLVYELGCSTGSLLIKLAERNSEKQVTISGIDCEAAMVKKAAQRTKKYNQIKIYNDDIVGFEYEKCDLIVSYYTIQFTHPKVRQEIFNKIYTALNWGGAFVLFEKVRAPDARFQDMMSGVYTDFKLTNGYSEAEIIGKTRSLKGVMEPFSTQGNTDLLKRAGFTDIMTVFKYVSFEGFLAIK